LKPIHGLITAIAALAATAAPVGQTTLNAINLGARILFVRF
jgi:hypothetical protein